MVAHIDLIIPGLFDIPVDELDAASLKLELPALNQLLRLGRPCINQVFDLESILIQCMGWSGLKTLPFAQAFAKAESLSSENSLLFKAIHLKADMHNAIVVPIGSSRDSDSEINIIINDLKELFKVDCNIEKIQNNLYLMHLKQCKPAQHYPHYLSIIGRKANPFIEQSKQALPWYKLMNEMQMFMHQHDINRKRLESDLLPINSLWFWGAGDLSTLNKKLVHWYCDDELLMQFAEVAGINCTKLDEIKQAGISCDSIVVDLTILEALKSPGEISLRSILVNLEARLFRPLLKSVKLHKAELRLRAGSTNDLLLGRYSTWKWWKKSKSLLDVIGH